jgi:hypothetical protein
LLLGGPQNRAQADPVSLGEVAGIGEGDQIEFVLGPAPRGADATAGADSASAGVPVGIAQDRTVESYFPEISGGGDRRDAGNDDTGAVCTGDLRGCGRLARSALDQQPSGKYVQITVHTSTVTGIPRRVIDIHTDAERHTANGLGMMSTRLQDRISIAEDGLTPTPANRPSGSIPTMASRRVLAHRAASEGDST